MPIVTEGTLSEEIGGDLSGSSGAPEVTGLQGEPLPTDGSTGALTFDGVAWTFEDYATPDALDELRLLFRILCRELRDQRVLDLPPELEAEADAAD